MSSIGSVASSAAYYAAAQSSAGAGTPADLADKIVQQAAASQSVSLSMEMIRSEADAMQQLVDILV